MPSRLLDPERALGDYLDEMLHQATTATGVKPIIDQQTGVILPEEMLSTADLDDPTKEAGAEFTPQAGAAVEQPTAGDAIEFPMQCLMFRVGGHLLSIPLVQLSSVVNWSRAPTRLPESPDWLLGLVKHRGSNLRIVDSRLLLNISSQHGRQPEHLLVLDDGGWAITCDRLEQVVNLVYDDIQWKPADSGQLVLGTIRQSLSTLLNPTGITRLLNGRVDAG